MPLYEYLCDDCGPFRELAPMDRYDQPCDCPGCGTAAPRVLLTAPRLATMDGGTRRAIETNERSRHAPRRSSAAERKSGHGPGCSCCSGTASKKTRTTADGAKSFPSMRPWMISH